MCISLGVLASALATVAVGQTSSAQQQPVISARSAKVLTVGGLRFKDLNRNSRLDPYEDWRLTAAERAQDLVGRMTIDEKIGLMVIGSQTMGAAPAGSDRVGRGGCQGPRSADGILCEERVTDTVNIFADPASPAARYSQPVVRTYPTSEAIKTYGVRRFIIREDPEPAALGAWTNRIQQEAETSRLGIPVVMTSNPRNHATQALVFGFGEASGKFSTWPGTLGLAATGDLQLISDFTRIAAREWNATGIRAGYMYQADIASDPRWFRIGETFGDDPVLVSNIIQSVVTGFQGGTQLQSGGVIVTTKHFPGGGPRDSGKDPHYVYGKASPYPTPGSLYQFHLPPFIAAIGAGGAAIMPYYALPSNARSVPQLPGGAAFEEVGFAYNRAILQDLLRTSLGFRGYVNSDSGILFSMPWGDRIAEMDYPARAAYAINAGVDVIGDMQDVGIIREAHRRGLISDQRIDLSAARLLTPMFQMGLFENPFRDLSAIPKIIAETTHDPRIYAAHQKSVVVLKNTAGLLPLTDEKLAGRRLYVQVLGATDRTDQVIAQLRRVDPTIQFTKSLDEAGVALVFVAPADPTKRQTESVFDLEIHAATGVDIDRLALIESRIPTIVAVNLEMPWLMGTIEPKAAALVAGFSTRVDATLDVLRGRVHPTGHLPVTLPTSLAAVVAAETNGPARTNRVTSSDVPGFARAPQDNYEYRDTSGGQYRTGFGLTY